jgi:hypothetical protein
LVLGSSVLGAEMSQPDSAGTVSCSPNKKQRVAYAQLIGPAFIRMQAFGFASLSSSAIDLRFINPSDERSIAEGVRAVLTEVKKQQGKDGLRFVAREQKDKNGKSVNYGYSSGACFSDTSIQQKHLQQHVFSYLTHMCPQLHALAFPLRCFSCTDAQAV